MVDTLYGETMGTRWRADLCVAPRTDLHALHAGIQAQLDRVVAQMSTWESGSDLSRFNRAPAGTWQALPEPFFDVLAFALDIAARSGGACDPTLGPLVDLWGFGAAGGGSADGARVPEARALAEARARVGWQRLALDRAARSALQPGGLSLDLSGIAKGYGVDAVVEWLRARGVQAALVDVGGELRGHGRKPDGTPWRVLVEASPEEDDADVPPCVVALDSLAAATSGDRWHRFEAGGRVYAHTIDPRTGAPVAHAAAAVTVLAADAMQADAWATALTVMGAADGIAFAAAHGLPARFVVRAATGSEVRATDAFLAHQLS